MQFVYHLCVHCMYVINASSTGNVYYVPCYSASALSVTYYVQSLLTAFEHRKASCLEVFNMQT